MGIWLSSGVYLLSTNELCGTIPCMITKCTAINHHVSCDGTLDTFKHAYSVRKIGDRTYYYRWLCGKENMIQLVPLHVKEREWLARLIRNTYKTEKSGFADSILKTIES